MNKYPKINPLDKPYVGFIWQGPPHNDRWFDEFVNGPNEDLIKVHVNGEFKWAHEKPSRIPRELHNGK